MRSKKLKCTLVSCLCALCAAALATACTGDATDTDTTAAATTAAITAEATDPTTEKETEPMTETNATTEPVTDAVTDTITETEEVTTEESTEAETECHILFEDDFSGAELDTTKWERLSEFSRVDKPSTEKGTWTDDMSYTDGDGHLILKVQYVEGEGILCGAIQSTSALASGYGYYEASIKFPLAYGVSNAFSLTGESGELDVIRSEASNKGVTYLHGVTNGDTDPQTLDALRTAFVNIYDGRFHAFGVLSDENGYTFYIDGIESGHLEADAVQNGRLTLSSLAPRALGSATAKAYDILSNPQFMEIDYVRAYSSLPESYGKAENAEVELVFNDDFEGNDIDNTKWTRCPEWTRNNLMYWSDSMSYVDGEGHLVIDVIWDTEKNSFKAGGIWSASTFRYGYGYYESSFITTTTHGTCSAFWMECGDLWSDSALTGAEIDIIECFNTAPPTYGHAIHSNYANLVSLGPTKLFEADVYDGQFHTFGLLRAENGYFFYVDGKLSAIVPHYNYIVCPENGFIEITVEASEWMGAGTPDSIASPPSSMVVDYVRVWDSMPDLSTIH